ncbi:hypothetical protein CRYUN_Cryun09bG0059500 [Craigia yunnanensis]
MRPNIVSEAGLQTRAGQWWDSIPFLTSAVIIVCGVIYLICLLVGYDSFIEICFLPEVIVSHFQVYRIYSSIIFHGSLLHVFFNMLALVPLGSELERIMGSVRLLYAIILLATSNAIFHLIIALVVAHNPFHPYPYLMNECAIGFSGILFSMIVIETNLSGVQSRSVFGLFNVPAKWYAFILLIVFQLLMTNVSLLGHLCGILSGFAYTYGLFNFLIPGPSFYSAIESSSWLVVNCFVLLNSRGVCVSIVIGQGQLCETTQIYSLQWWKSFSLHPHFLQSKLTLQWTIFWKHLEKLVFLDATEGDSCSARPLDNSSHNNPSDIAAAGAGERLSNERRLQVNNVVAAGAGGPPLPQMQQGSIASDEQIQKLVSMGFERNLCSIRLHTLLHLHIKN